MSDPDPRIVPASDPDAFGVGDAAAPTPRDGAGAKYLGISDDRASLLIPVGRLAPDPDQPRKEFDEDDLERLGRSLRERGQLQPIRVRWDEASARWVVVAGERRYRAAIRAGLESLLCVDAGEGQSADDRLEDQLVENCLRADLKPLERARAFRALLERKGCSYRELADQIHVSAGGIAQSLALLRLPESIQARVDAGALAPTVAYEIARIPEAEIQRELAARVEAEGMNRREAIELARRAMPGRRRRNRPSQGGMPAIRSFRTRHARVDVVQEQAGDESAILAALEEAVIEQKRRILASPP